jgi:uncharacterized protein (TIGR02117 family)
MLKKILKTLGKTFIGLLAFVCIYLLCAFCLSRMTVQKESNTSTDVAIYIMTNGVHTDIVVPIKTQIIDWSKQIRFANTKANDTNFNYLSIGWGDKGFYLETPQWKDLKASVAFKAASGLGASAIHATFYKSMLENDRCKKINISWQQYQRLTNYILSSLCLDKNGQTMLINTNSVYGMNYAFYEANGHYSLINTCNTWANDALKKSGQTCCVWTPFDTGIFLKY